MDDLGDGSAEKRVFLGNCEMIAGNKFVILASFMMMTSWVDAAAVDANAVADIDKVITQLESIEKESVPGDRLRAQRGLAHLRRIRNMIACGQLSARERMSNANKDWDRFWASPAAQMLTADEKRKLSEYKRGIENVMSGKIPLTVQEDDFGFDNGNGEAVLSVKLEASILKRGDLILVRNIGPWSHLIANASTRERRFSHVGIVIDEHPTCQVVTVGYDEVQGSDGVCKEELVSLIDSVADLCVYRLDGADSIRDAVARAAEKRIGTPFDVVFDLKTKDRLYCTEMVRDCVNEAVGRELIGTSRKGDFEYVAVDDCYRNEMTKVWDCRDAKPVEVNPVVEEKPVEKPQPSPVSVSPVSTTNAPVRRIIRFVPKNGGRR